MSCFSHFSLKYVHLYNVLHTSTSMLSVVLMLQDTAGEERYASLSSFYCRGAAVAILVVDLTEALSVRKLKEVFIPLLHDSVESCLTVVVGTKLDCATGSDRQVTPLQYDIGYVYMYTSLHSVTCYLYTLQWNLSNAEINWTKCMQEWYIPTWVGKVVLFRGVLLFRG